MKWVISHLKQMNESGVMFIFWFTKALLLHVSEGTQPLQMVKALNIPRPVLCSHSTLAMAQRCLRIGSRGARTTTRWIGPTQPELAWPVLVPPTFPGSPRWTSSTSGRGQHNFVYLFPPKALQIPEGAIFRNASQKQFSPGVLVQLDAG
jgi:hypothetical protein